MDRANVGLFELFVTLIEDRILVQALEPLVKGRVLCLLRYLRLEVMGCGAGLDV